jgi:hypothetical protein
VTSGELWFPRSMIRHSISRPIMAPEAARTLVLPPAQPAIN